ncbi:tetratricopeptide repeat-containing sulfotransferase family protein [Afifella sp. YEN Y35]|uniref:tetratricopeptide repeat-containing sulfotransferase family protein n=1 Tax=Afifella sp. YEN Y35 TaxID=3388337 RepID=UPI0039E18E38
MTHDNSHSADGKRRRSPDEKRAMAASIVAKGAGFERAGRLDAALAHYRQAQTLLPRDAQINFAIGRIFVGVGRPADAIEPLKAAVAAKRKEPEPRHLLGLAYLESGDISSALRQLKEAVSLAPKAPALLSTLGSAYLRAGDADKAEEMLRRAAELNPRDPTAKLRLAGLVLYRGRNADAEKLYRDMLASGDRRPVVYAGLLEAGRFEDEPPEYADIEAMAEDAKHPKVERRMLHFGLSGLDRRLKREEKSFAHATAGNALLPEFDLGYFAEMVAAFKEAVTPDFFSERRSIGHDSEVPVLIFGMPRSGTSLMEQIVTAHPQAAAAGELPFFQRAVSELGIRFTRERNAVPPEKLAAHLQSLDGAQLSRIAPLYLERLKQIAGPAARITDKTPHNFLHLWLIALLFPKARFIHARRDPMATCFSCFTTDLGDWHAYRRDLTTLGRYYGLYEELTAHVTAVLPQTVFECRYEELVGDPENAAPKLVDAAGLSWDPRCLDFHASKRLTQTASHAQVREPVHTRRVEAWRAYEAYLEPLKAALSDTKAGSRAA